MTLSSARHVAGEPAFFGENSQVIVADVIVGREGLAREVSVDQPKIGQARYSLREMLVGLTVDADGVARIVPVEPGPEGYQRNLDKSPAPVFQDSQSNFSLVVRDLEPKTGFAPGLVYAFPALGMLLEARKNIAANVADKIFNDKDGFIVKHPRISKFATQPVRGFARNAAVQAAFLFRIRFWFEVGNWVNQGSFPSLSEVGRAADKNFGAGDLVAWTGLAVYGSIRHGGEALANKALSGRAPTAALASRRIVSPAVQRVFAGYLPVNPTKTWGAISAEMVAIVMASSLGWFGSDMWMALVDSDRVDRYDISPERVWLNYTSVFGLATVPFYSGFGHLGSGIGNLAALKFRDFVGNRGWMAPPLAFAHDLSARVPQWRAKLHQAVVQSTQEGVSAVTDALDLRHGAVREMPGLAHWRDNVASRGIDPAALVLQRTRESYEATDARLEADAANLGESFAHARAGSKKALHGADHSGWAWEEIGRAFPEGHAYKILAKRMEDPFRRDAGRGREGASGFGRWVSRAEPSVLGTRLGLQLSRGERALSGVMQEAGRALDLADESYVYARLKRAAGLSTLELGDLSDTRGVFRRIWNGTPVENRLSVLREMARINAEIADAVAETKKFLVTTSFSYAQATEIATSLIRQGAASAGGDALAALNTATQGVRFLQSRVLIAADTVLPAYSTPVEISPVASYRFAYAFDFREPPAFLGGVGRVKFTLVERVKAHAKRVLDGGAVYDTASVDALVGTFVSLKSVVREVSDQFLLESGSGVGAQVFRMHMFLPDLTGLSPEAMASRIRYNTQMMAVREEVYRLMSDTRPLAGVEPAVLSKLKNLSLELERVARDFHRVRNSALKTFNKLAQEKRLGRLETEGKTDEARKLVLEKETAIKRKLTSKLSSMGYASMEDLLTKYESAEAALRQARLEVIGKVPTLGALTIDGVTVARARSRVSGLVRQMAAAEKELARLMAEAKKAGASAVILDQITREGGNLQDNIGRVRAAADEMDVVRRLGFERAPRFVRWTANRFAESVRATAALDGLYFGGRSILRSSLNRAGGVSQAAGMIAGNAGVAALLVYWGEDLVSRALPRVRGLQDLEDIQPAYSLPRYDLGGNEE